MRTATRADENGSPRPPIAEGSQRPVSGQEPPPLVLQGWHDLEAGRLTDVEHVRPSWAGRTRCLVESSDAGSNRVAPATPWDGLSALRACRPVAGNAVDRAFVAGQVAHESIADRRQQATGIGWCELDRAVETGDRNLTAVR
jgi:hypothetical protein